MTIDDIFDSLPSDPKVTYGARENFKQELKSLLLSEAVDYDLVTHDFGTPQIVAQTKAVPIEAINKLFGDE